MRLSNIILPLAALPYLTAALPLARPGLNLYVPRDDPSSAAVVPATSTDAAPETQPESQADTDTQTDASSTDAPSAHASTNSSPSADNPAGSIQAPKLNTPSGKTVGIFPDNDGSTSVGKTACEFDRVVADAPWKTGQISDKDLTAAVMKVPANAQTEITQAKKAYDNGVKSYKGTGGSWTYRDFFKATSSGSWTLPANDAAKAKLEELAKAYNDSVKKYMSGDGIIMGDFNAGCSYLKKSS